MTGNVVVYQGSHDWSALYINGTLAEYGDHEYVDEAIRAHFGVETISSDSFMLGGSGHKDVAHNLYQIELYEIEQIAANRRRAEELRKQARGLLAAAREIDGLDGY